MVVQPIECFKLNITRLRPGPMSEEKRIRSMQELDNELAFVKDWSVLAIGMTALAEGDTDWGSFWLFLKGERAWVHLIEGMCRTARDPLLVTLAEELIEFVIDTGESIKVRLRDTLSRDQGLKALRHWVAESEELAELRWGPA